MQISALDRPADSILSALEKTDSTLSDEFQCEQCKNSRFYYSPAKCKTCDGTSGFEPLMAN